MHKGRTPPDVIDVADFQAGVASWVVFDIDVYLGPPQFETTGGGPNEASTCA
jgi:hypothetical protein